jgi:Tol biopolymer transport system component
LCYERDDDSGYTQIWRVSASGGSEQQLTFGNSDHFLPSYLNSNEIVFTYSPNDGYDQIAKVDVNTHQVTVLSSSETDHNEPSPSRNGLFVAAEADDASGNSQIVRIVGTGVGETWLTSGASDIMAPDYGQDNQTIFAVRGTGITSQIVRVDAVNGGYTAVTDSLAIRDNPDAYVDTLLSTALSVYEREAWSPEYLLLGGGRRKHGSGVYLSKVKKHHPHEGSQGASIGILALDKAKPNPAKNRVTIRWQVPVEADVSLSVYNAAGQLVKVLAEGRTKPGSYTSVWSGSDSKGRRMANGVYFYTFDNGTKRISRKIILTE